MAVIFADSFDIYTSTQDMVNSNQWSTVQGNLSTTTPFGTGQSFSIGFQNSIAPFGTNETIIYGSFRLVHQTAGGSGYIAITFTDGVTSQSTIRWYGDGSIALYTGGSSGTLIGAPYPGMYSAAAWNSFQFKVVIGSSGSIEIRMNGATTNIITALNVNTQSTTHNYATGINVYNSSAGGWVDDMFLNNAVGNAPTSWPGEVRAIQQVPIGTTVSGFVPIPSTTAAGIVTNATQGTQPANTAVYTAFTSPATGSVNSVAFVMNANFTGNVRWALYDASGPSGTPGVVLASTSPLNNPPIGTNTANFTTAPYIIFGNNYYVGVIQDGTANYRTNFVNTYFGTTVTYGNFPASNPPVTFAGNVVTPACTLNITNNNANEVRDVVSDSDASYVSSNIVAQDKYNLSAIPLNYSVLAVQYYVHWRKTDSGARTVALSVTANGSADTTEIVNNALPTSYVGQFKLLELDPTGAAWTPSTVNSALIGIAVTA